MYASNTDANAHGYGGLPRQYAASRMQQSTLAELWHQYSADIVISKTDSTFGTLFGALAFESVSLPSPDTVFKQVSTNPATQFPAGFLMKWIVNTNIY